MNEILKHANWTLAIEVCAYIFDKDGRQMPNGGPHFSCLENSSWKSIAMMQI